MKLKYKILEPRLSPPLPQQQQSYKEFEALLMEHLNESSKAGTFTFPDWLACQQALMQLRQIQAAESMLEILKMMPRNPFMG